MAFLAISLVWTYWTFPLVRFVLTCEHLTHTQTHANLPNPRLPKSRDVRPICYYLEHIFDSVKQNDNDHYGKVSLVFDVHLFN